MRCPHCGAKIEAKDLDTSTMQLRCPSCGIASGLSAKRNTPRVSTPKPAKVIVTELSDGVQLSWRWFQPVHIFLAIFTLVWWLFLVGWYSSILSGPPGFFDWIFFVFPLIHVAAGVFLAYTALCCLVNSTTITLKLTKEDSSEPYRGSPRAGGSLTVSHGPLPNKGRVELPTDSISQLYCSQLIQRSQKGSSSTIYHLNALFSDGEMKVLCQNLESIELGHYIEQQLEARLGIVDSAVSDELPKKS